MNSGSHSKTFGVVWSLGPPNARRCWEGTGIATGTCWTLLIKNSTSILYICLEMEIDDGKQYVGESGGRMADHAAPSVQGMK